QRVEKVSKESKIWPMTGVGLGRDGEQGEHHAQTASLPTSTRSTRDMPSIDERFESVRLLHPKVARGRHIDEPGAILDPSVEAADVQDREEPAIQTNVVNGIVKPTILPETNNSTNANRAIHRDRPLHEDYVLRTILPVEEIQIGYATLERLSYALRTRFPDLPKSEVLELLVRLEEKRLIEQKPFPRCWRR